MRSAGKAWREAGAKINIKDSMGWKKVHAEMKRDALCFERPIALALAVCVPSTVVRAISPRAF